MEANKAEMKTPEQIYHFNSEHLSREQMIQIVSGQIHYENNLKKGYFRVGFIFGVLFALIIGIVAKWYL